MITSTTGFNLPLFVPCLLMGIPLSNTVPLILRCLRWLARTASLELISSYALSIFLAMSLMSTQLWTLAGMAGTLLIVVAVQTGGYRRPYPAGRLSDAGARLPGSGSIRRLHRAVAPLDANGDRIHVGNHEEPRTGHRTPSSFSRWFRPSSSILSTSGPHALPQALWPQEEIFVAGGNRSCFLVCYDARARVREIRRRERIGGAPRKDDDDRERSLEPGEQGIRDEELALLDRWWRACNYLSDGMIYLSDNPRLREPLKPQHVKRRLLGHWGASPALSFVWAHLNRVIRCDWVWPE